MKEESIINIPLASIIRECSYDTSFGYQHHKNLKNSTYNLIHDVFHYRKFQEDFGDYFTLYQNKNCIIGNFRPCYEEFVEKVAYFLNMKLNDPKDDEEFERKGMKRLEVLKNIQTEEELSVEFPVLYQDLVAGRYYMNLLDEQKPYLSEEEYKEMEHYYYSCALQRSLKNFIPRQVELYKRFIGQRKQYEELTRMRSANRYLETYFDKNKIAMLIVAELLWKGEHTDNRQEIRKYLKIIGRYLTSDYDMSSPITDNHGNKVGMEDIAKRTYQLRKKEKGMNVIVNWELVPEGKRLFSIPKESKATRKTKMSQAQIENLRKIGEEKEKVYEESGYLQRVVGKSKCKGYIAYIYSNGEVLLDREYDPEHLSSATGNALFNMKIMDFEALSKLDKYTLANHPNATRIIHSKKWKEKVEEIISREGTKEEQEQVKQFIKRMKNES